MVIQIKIGQKVQKIDIIMILEMEMQAKDECNNNMGDEGIENLINYIEPGMLLLL